MAKTDIEEVLQVRVVKAAFLRGYKVVVILRTKEGGIKKITEFVKQPSDLFERHNIKF